MLRENSSNSIERELENVITRLWGVKALEPSQQTITDRKCSSQEIEIRIFEYRIREDRPDRIFESMEKSLVKINLRLCQEVDSLINVLQIRITRSNIAALNDKAIPKIQSIRKPCPRERATLGRVRPLSSRSR